MCIIKEILDSKYITESISCYNKPYNREGYQSCRSATKWINSHLLNFIENSFKLTKNTIIWVQPQCGNLVVTSAN